MLKNLVQIKCKNNRSTFYANYLDVYDLAEKVVKRIEEDVFSLYKEERETKNNSHNYLKLFRHIKDNQLFYKTYFKLGFDNKHSIFHYDTNLSKKYFDDKFIEYHIVFFKNGLNSIIKLWLNNGCKESPEEIDSIIKSEYAHRKT